MQGPALHRPSITRPARPPARSARREFVQCGILRQLLATIGRNLGPQYGIILRKVGLREALLGRRAEPS